MNFAKSSLRYIIQSVLYAEAKAKALSVRMTAWTGRSPVPVHPKHLIEDPCHRWYMSQISGKDTVLDVGCGRGSHCMLAAGLSASVTGIDTDCAHLADCRTQAREMGLSNVVFQQSDAEKALPFPDGSFTRIIFMDVLEHLENRAGAVRECFRVLEEGGILFITVPNRNTPWKKLQRSAGLSSYSDKGHKHEFSEEEIVRLLTENGFSVDGPIEPIVWDGPGAGIFDIIGGISLELYAGWMRCKRMIARCWPGTSTGFRVTARKTG